jgi:hypothetical protein
MFMVVLADLPTSPADGGTLSVATRPAWAKALGPGVALRAPSSTPPGNGDPAAAVEGALLALAAGNLGKSCRYIEPALQAGCEKNAGAKVHYTETIKDFAIGYVAIDDRRALVGFTGTLCISPSTPTCMTNRNPAAILSSGKPFATLWSESVTAENNPANIYSLDPSVEVGHSWYFYVGPNAS